MLPYKYCCYCQCCSCCRSVAVVTIIATSFSVDLGAAVTITISAAPAAVAFVIAATVSGTFRAAVLAVIAILLAVAVSTHHHAGRCQEGGVCDAAAEVSPRQHGRINRGRRPTTLKFHDYSRIYFSAAGCFSSAVFRDFLCTMTVVGGEKKGKNLFYYGRRRRRRRERLRYGPENHVFGRSTRRRRNEENTYSLFLCC